MESKTGIYKYSVVLCTHNQASRLRKTLSRLEALRQPDAAWELLIINNASTDETQQVIESNSWRPETLPIRTIFEPKLGIANARNRGVAEAEGDYIIFIDDDETPHPDWIIEYERAIRTWHPDALGGPIEVLFEEAEQPSWLQDELLGFLGRLSHGHEPKRLVEHATAIFTGNACFKKAIFEVIGHFDSGLGRKGTDNSGGEDVEFYRRMIDAGMDIRWVPEAIIYHRIQAHKLRKAYFIDLHYRQGHMEGSRARGDRSRIPPLYLAPQYWRAFKSAMSDRFHKGSDFSLRKEMNIAYFSGYIAGWIKK